MPTDPAPEALFWPWPRYAVIDSWPPALSTCGRASAQRGRSGPEAGAAPAAEPGARPAERSAAGCLDDVEKV
ncbi:hypothetical protein C4B68_12595 [Streptomyces dengpaensis]|uniref:Uncharacterized protein n=1 Tax=Streptomyces dengpaensis TaxID=2049881 RepID=A0ABM6SQQ3_9ACTN|nr:hypothetical protein C4B68_12595 [Streptomyces dengpaensis]PIB10496.1 hypothetical protein B1C81_08505 [Streptomyces sp. HG99]